MSIFKVIYVQQADLLKKQIIGLQEKLAQVEAILLVLEPKDEIQSLQPPSPAQPSSPSTSPVSEKKDVLSLMKDSEPLRIYTDYGRKILAEGVFHKDLSEKKGYHVYDNDTRKTYKSFTNWSLSKKKEKNPSLKADNGFTSVHVNRDGKWIKISALL
jgi:hypothetical protein